MEKRTYWIYILYCENNSYYTGYTTNINRRYADHLAGKACKYTRSFKPLKLSQSWEIIGDKSLAMKLEYYIKKLSHAKKEELIQHPEQLKSQYNGNNEI